MDKTAINALIESIGLTYTARFVPFSVSRNRAEKNRSLNWVITLQKGKELISTDYMQGIAHVPNYCQSLAWNTSYDNYLKTCVEGGRYIKGITAKNFHSQTGIVQPLIPKPELTDILYALVLDSSAMDSGCFENWADEYGYDTDSIQAKKTYEACIKIALDLNLVIGASNVVKLREAFQDY